MTVRTWVDGGVGRIELDRQEALNALDHDMVRRLHEVLTSWRTDEAVGTVVVTGAGRAFCAGGDVRSARDAVLDGRHDAAERYFVDEYALNRLVAEYPKPYVAVLDGVTMGGGLGVSVHGDVRVVTDRSLLAMPETALGFATDVGMTYAFSRLDGDPAGAVGRYLALTGARVGAADALALGLATHYVPTEEAGDLVEALIRDGLTALDRRARRPAEGATLTGAIRDAVEGDFAGEGAEEILARLDARAGTDSPAARWAAETAATLRAACPTSLVTVLELLAAARSSPLADCLERETRAASWLIGRPDFAEGVRAVLVDKDRTPTWSPSDLAEVDVAEVRGVLGAGARPDHPVASSRPVQAP
ncbi:enoyl-CoA hydratase/isomerase family protein [Georgenia alba]|uniref:3-hydroxyisobutyryl-CoA hydrolase n=1 Tax=Georgenia alba TaxID=2233858 RepID=A0ABW2Q6A8_9MICO